jgi:hypothetical protein
VSDINGTISTQGVRGLRGVLGHAIEGVKMRLKIT